MSNVHPPARRKNDRRAAPILMLATLLALGVLPGLAGAGEPQQRWVYGPERTGDCGSTPGFPSLHAALETIDPRQPATIFIAQSYQHRVPDGPDPRVTITSAHSGDAGPLRLMGGKACTASGEIVDRFPGARSRLTAVAGGRIMLINSAYTVDLEDIEFVGGRAAPGAVHPALHIVGPDFRPMTVNLRRIVIADNHAGTSGVLLITRAQVNIEGAHFRDNQSGQGAAMAINQAARVTITNLPGSPEFATTRFENNRATAGSGGAIAMLLGSDSDQGSRLALIGRASGGSPGILFSGNTATKGGAIEIGRRSELEVTGDVRFIGNAADKGGAIAVNLDASGATLPRVSISASADGASPVFEGNRASTEGGALHCQPSDASSRNVPAIALGPASFTRNEAGLRGGAIHVDGCRVSSLEGPGRLDFFLNRVTIGTADPAAAPAARGGGALFATRASVILGAQGEFTTEFIGNRVERTNGFWGRECGNQYCVLRALSGGAVMLFEADGQFHDGIFADNVAPFGGAISAVDSRLTVDQSGRDCADIRGCSRFLRNRATGAAYLASEAASGRARRGYGAAIAVRNDNQDPVHGPRHVRIQRSWFTGHGSGCPTGMSCAQDTQRIMRGRVIQANVRGDMALRLRGNLFADNAQADDVATSAAQSDDAEVSAFSRPPGGAHLPVILVANTMWKDPLACGGAPWLVDVRDSGGNSPRGLVESASNLLLGCASGRVFTQAANIDFRTYACNIADGPTPAADVSGHNQWQPSRREFFVDPDGGDYRLSGNVYGNVSTDVCGTDVAGQSIARLFDGLGSDLAGQPRPVAFGGGLSPEAGDWDVGAYERQPAVVSPMVFADGFE